MPLNIAVTGAPDNSQLAGLFDAGASAAGGGSGAAVGAVVGTAVLGPGLGTAIGGLVGSVSNLFGTGDVSPFQDQRIRDLATLAASDIRGNWWAFQWLCGESGRWGLVWVDGGRRAHLPAIPHSAQDDVRKWLVEGASNYGGGVAADAVAGPTTRYGSQDLAYQAALMIAQEYGITLPAPTLPTVDGGYKDVGNIVGTGIPPASVPGNYLAAAGATGPLKLVPPSAVGSTLGQAASAITGAFGKSNVAGIGVIAAILLGLLWLARPARARG